MPSIYAYFQHAQFNNQIFRVNNRCFKSSIKFNNTPMLMKKLSLVRLFLIHLKFAFGELQTRVFRNRKIVVLMYKNCGISMLPKRRLVKT